MERYKRILFVTRNGTSRAPMAAEILKDMMLAGEPEICARGLVVLFPEPINQKAEAVMIGNGIRPEGFTSEQLKDTEIIPGTLVLTMSADLRDRIISKYEHASEENVHVLTDYVGEELEIVDPYGGTLQLYGLCFESLNRTLRKFADKWNGEDTDEYTG